MKEREELLQIKLQKLYQYLPRSRDSQGRILKILSSHKSMTQKELQNILGIQAGSLSEVIRKLEKQGHVRKEPDPEDKRRQILTITDEGRKAFERIHEEHRENAKKFFAVLDEKDQEDLLKIFDKLLDVYGEPYKHEWREKNEQLNNIIRR